MQVIKPPTALRIVAMMLCMFPLRAAGQSTAADHHRAIEKAATTAFEAAFRREAGRGIKHVSVRYLSEVCTANEFKRNHWDGMYTFERVKYTNELDLENRMSALIHQWQVDGSSKWRGLYPANFPDVKRFAVASCGAENGTTTVVVAVFKSGWATYWENWGTLLGK